MQQLSYLELQPLVEVKWKNQREAAVTLALALRQQFSVYGEVLKQVEVFKYLGCLLAQDDDDIRLQPLVEVEWKKQREMAVTLALALRQQFSVYGEVLKQF